MLSTCIRGCRSADINPSIIGNRHHELEKDSKWLTNTGVGKIADLRSAPKKKSASLIEFEIIHQSHTPSKILNDAVVKSFVALLKDLSIEI